MKVYIVWEQYGAYDPHNLVNLYATKEAAEAEVKRREDPENYHYSVWWQEKEVIEG